jgi:hypothetical protein
MVMTLPIYPVLFTLAPTAAVAAAVSPAHPSCSEQPSELVVVVSKDLLEQQRETVLKETTQIVPEAVAAAAADTQVKPPVDCCRVAGARAYMRRMLSV